MKRTKELKDSNFGEGIRNSDAEIGIRRTE
jgi:hypothetical protein